MKSSHLSGAISILNHLLASAPWARNRLAGYADSVVSIRVGTFLVLFRICDTGHVVLPADDSDPAVTITVPLQSLPGMLASGSKAFPADVRVEGSAELADAVGFVLRNLRWDVEEDLSHVIGDIPARRVTTTAQSLKRTGVRAVDAIAGNLSEYLDEGAAPVVGRLIHDRFATDVSALRDAVARLDKRLARYEKTGH